MTINPETPQAPDLAQELNKTWRLGNWLLECAVFQEVDSGFKDSLASRMGITRPGINFVSNIGKGNSSASWTKVEGDKITILSVSQAPDATVEIESLVGYRQPAQPIEKSPVKGTTIRILSKDAAVISEVEGATPDMLTATSTNALSVYDPTAVAEAIAINTSIEEAIKQFEITPTEESTLRRYEDITGHPLGY